MKPIPIVGSDISAHLAVYRLLPAVSCIESMLSLRPRGFAIVTIEVILKQRIYNLSIYTKAGKMVIFSFWWCDVGHSI